MKKILFYLGLAAVITLGGCYPEGPEYVEDMDVVVTNYDNNFNFDGANTFFLPDKVILASGDPDPNNPQYLKDVYANTILSTIKQNMLDRGYTETDSANADLSIFPAALEVDITVYYEYWYNYWGWYGYGWYYPPYYTSYSFTVGTVLINMIDHKSSNGNSKNMVWFAGINGLTDDAYIASAQSRLTSTVNRAFAQSPYLKTN